SCPAAATVREGGSTSPRSTSSASRSSADAGGGGVMSRPKLLAGLGVLFAIGLGWQSTLPSPTTAPRQRGPDELLRLSPAPEGPGLAEPFRGITTNGTIESGLFSIRSTGVSTAPVRRATEAFVNGLTPEQRRKTTFKADDVEWRKWMNQSFYVRAGVSFLEMNASQRDLAFALLQASPPAQ